MFAFPPEFVPIKYPGYFWNVKTKKLYSIKGTGVLKPLKARMKPVTIRPSSCYSFIIPPGYTVSVNGNNYHLTFEELEKMNVIPLLKSVQMCMVFE
jgi:hypothetical protein